MTIYNRKNKWALSLMIALLFIGCADHMPRRQLDLANETRIEDELAKLEKISKEHPDNLASRADYIREHERAVNFLLLLADRMHEQGRDDEATSYYLRAQAIEPENARARDGIANIEMSKRQDAVLQMAQELFDKGDYESSLAKLQAIFVETPDHAAAVALRHEIEQQQAKNNKMAVPSLQSKFRKPVSLQFRDANLKMVFEALSRTSNINILLDRDVRADLKTTIFVKDATVEDTIDLILMQNQLEKKVLNENTVFVYPNTPAKTKEYQDLVIRTFHFTNADAKQMQSMIKTLLKTKDLFINEKTNSLVMRDTPEAVRLAEKMVAGQDFNEPEVMLEVEVLEVLHSKLTELGIKWPNQVGLSITETPATNTTTTTSGGAVVTSNLPAIPLTIDGLRHLKGSSIKVAPLSVFLDLKKELGDTNLLASPRIRVKQREKAKILIGDRVPVITNSVTPVSTGTPVVTGNVQYLEVGLKLEVEPEIHMDDEVAIKTFLEVSSIAREVTNSSSGTVAFQIGTRTASTVLRLKDGETQVLAGLINDEVRKSVTKVPGLGDLPLIGRLFASHRNDNRKTEIILSITPHIIRNNHRPDADIAEFWSGTDAVLRSKPLSIQSAGLVKTGTSAANVALAPQARPAASLAPIQARPQPAVPSRVIIPPPVATQTVPAATALVPNAAPTPVSAPAGDTLLLTWRGAAQAKVGEQFAVNIDAQTAGKVTGLPFQIGFDPNVLEVVEVTEGDFLKQNNGKTVFTPNIDQAGGQVSVNITQSGADGASGKGSIAAVTFKVLAAKPLTQLTLISASPVGVSGAAIQAAPPTPYAMVLNP